VRSAREGVGRNRETPAEFSRVSEKTEKTERTERTERTE